MVFVTLFLRTEDMHLLKDVGLLPYHLFRDRGVDASIATYKNSGTYPSLDELAGLKLDFVKKSSLGAIFDGLAYLSKNAANIDVLNLYHLNLSSYFWSAYYRMKNKRGKIYLKLDMDHFDLERLKKPSLVRMVKNATLRRASIVSAESTFMADEVKALPVMRGRDVLLTANGLYIKHRPMIKDKRRIFLTVGRLGTEQKATEVLLDAFKRIADKCEWSLRLAGSVEKGFEEVIAGFYAEDPQLKERVTFTGLLGKEELEREYADAAVFVLSSRWESFGLVLTEAAAQGCRIISTDVVPPLSDMTDNGRFGCAVPADDAEALSDAMLRFAQDFERGAGPAPSEISEYTLTRFDWSDICGRLYASLAGNDGQKGETT